MHILKNTALRILLTTNGLVLLAGAMLGPIYALFVEEVGGDILDAGFAGAVFAISAGTMCFVMGRIGDHSKHKVWIVSCGYCLIGASFLLYRHVDSMQALLAVQILFGIGEAMYSPVYDGMYSEHLDQGKSASEWGVWECMNYWLSAVGSLMGGYVAFRLGFDVLFVIMASFCFLAAGGMLWMQKKI